MEVTGRVSRKGVTWFDLHDRKISQAALWRRKCRGPTVRAGSHFRYPVFNEVVLRDGRKGMDFEDILELYPA